MSRKFSKFFLTYYECFVFLNVYHYEIQTVIMYIVRVHSTIQLNQYWIKVLVLEHLNSAFKEQASVCSVTPRAHQYQDFFNL